METSEIRQDKVTKQWVIYAPARRKRPSDFRGSVTPPRPLPSRDEECPFCPGNERMILPPLDEVEGGDGRSFHGTNSNRGTLPHGSRKNR